MLLSPKTGKERIRKNPPCFVPESHALKAFPCQQPAGHSLCCRVSAGRIRVFFSQFSPLSSAPALLYLLQFGCEAFFKYTSLILLCGASGIRRLSKKRNMEFGSWAATCKDHGGRQTEESFYIFVFFHGCKVTGSSSH